MQAVVPGNVPVGKDPVINKQLAEAWKDMGECMSQLAKMSNGKNYDENLTPSDVMENLNAIQNPRKQTSAQWKKIKNGFNNTLTMIGIVGGMVADAASQVSSSSFSKECR